MAVKLISRQNDSIREWAAQPYQAVQQNAQAHTQYELMDENGNPIHDYTATIQDGNLLIDVAGTSASPDFILNHYTQYFTEPPTQGTGLFGASEAVHSEAVKASTVSTADSEGLGNVLGTVLGIGAAAGLAYFVKKKLDKDDDKNPPSAQSNSNTTPDVSTTPTTSQTNNNPANTNNNTPKPSGEKDFMHGNEIKLPTAYTQQVLSGNDMNAITQAGRDGTQMNQYQSSEENKNIIINDLNNLPREVQLELSLFVAGLLNPIRQKWGVGLLKVTEGAMNFAQDIANEYVLAGRSIFDGKKHYVEGITKAVAKYGLDTGNNWYENMGGAFMGRNKTTVTLDDIKKSVYESVVRMLFEDAHSEHGHAKSLLNAMRYADQNAATDYLGIDTSRVVINSSSKEWGEYSIHFIQATDHRAYIDDQAKFNTTIATPELTKMSHDGMAYYIRPDHDEETDKPSFVTYQEYNEDKSQANASDDDANHHDATQNTFLLSQLVDGNIHQLMNQYSEKSVLQLPQNTFSALLSDLSNLNEHIDYHKETGILTYDADGQTGEMEAVAIAQLPTQLNPDQLHFEVV